MLVRKSPRSLFSIPQRTYRQMTSTSRRLRPVDWKADAPEPVPGTLTFGAQSTLPQLPVPDLQNTLERLKESLRPIAWSDAEYASVVQKIDNFGQGKGPELHKRLLRRTEERKHWLEEWWDDAGYLGYRDSVRSFRIIRSCFPLTTVTCVMQVVINVSYYCRTYCRHHLKQHLILTFLCRWLRSTTFTPIFSSGCPSCRDR